MDHSVSAPVSRSLTAVFVSWSTLVFLILAGATVFSFLVGEGRVHFDARAAGAMILVVGFTKAALIIEHFMETRHAPWPMRVAGLAWAVVVCTAVLLLYPF